MLANIARAWQCLGIMQVRSSYSAVPPISHTLLCVLATPSIADKICECLEKVEYATFCLYSSLGVPLPRSWVNLWVVSARHGVAPNLPALEADYHRQATVE